MPLKPYHHVFARHLGGTFVEFTCKGCGHVWQEDLTYPKGKRYRHIRLSEAAVANLARWWSHPGSNVTATCPKCWKAQKAREAERILKRPPD